MLTSNKCEAVAFVRSDPPLAAPDYELMWFPIPFLGGGLTPPPGHGLSLAMVLLQPDSRGDIGLASADPAEPPVIDPGYFTAESDLRGLVAGLRIAERLCDTAALRPYVGAPWRHGQARSMMRTWRGTFGNTPDRRSTLSAPAGWAATTPRWWTVSCGSAAHLPYFGAPVVGSSPPLHGLDDPEVGEVPLVSNVDASWP